MGMRATALVLLVVALTACASRPVSNGAPASETRNDFGVLVMAHGGSAQWNRDVLSAVEPLKTRYNLEVAFGMADAATLQKGVRALEDRGARRIGVVRLFVSGESFLERTEQILGVKPGAPPSPADSVTAQASDESHAGHHHGPDMPFWKLRTDASFALSTEGLLDAPEMGAVLAERAKALSRQPEMEDVLILAHGPEDDAENARWLAKLEARADSVRKILPFRQVHVETLREDWPDKRTQAEQRIRTFVQSATEQGRTVIVVPFRVQGFGPYARVLKDLSYKSDGVGLIPHPAVTEWIDRQSESLQRTAAR
jgi:sirohydrochlorin ferrochelatase